MDFDLMTEFYDKINEAKTDFNYFPEEWETSVSIGEKFKDYAELFSNNGKETLPFSSRVLDNYKGFVKLPESFNKSQNLDVSFVFMENRKALYSQFEREEKDFKMVETDFYYKGAYIQRGYKGSLFSDMTLNILRRVVPYNFPNEKILRVIQYSSDYFDIEFLKDKKRIFGFFLDGTDWEYHNKYIEGIKVCPELFQDLELFKDFFSIESGGKVEFEGIIGNKKKIETISPEYWISKWQNA